MRPFLVLRSLGDSMSAFTLFIHLVMRFPVLHNAREIVTLLLQPDRV